MKRATYRSERGQPRPRESVHRDAPTRRPALLWLLPASLGICLTACAPRQSPLTADQRAAIYERAYVQFTNVMLFKPLEAGPTNTLAFKLAPLLVQEVINTNEAIALPVVFFEEGKILLAGKSHEQVAYIWQAPTPTNSLASESTVQGIRITLNSSGSPVIWEVLADDTGGELIFVSQSVEAAALKEFGPPTAGRRFAIEAGLDTSPNAVVARVIEDGPVPMGPIVHLSAGLHNVSTLICRCMPTQAKNLLATETYQLRPLAESKLWSGFDRVGEGAAAGLTRSLRLPGF